MIDLDSLPWPYRDDIDYLAHDLPTASVLGSRGCPWDCSFCSIRPFYEAQEGPLRRMRPPEAIVEEICAIHRERGVPVFLFQDDDFLGGGKRARQWACAIADGLVQAGLAGKVAFKVSCRSDEIDPDCQQLTRHEHAEEERLLQEVVDFYWSVRQRRMLRSAGTALQMVGGFEKSWTNAERMPS